MQPNFILTTPVDNMSEKPESPDLSENCAPYLPMADFQPQYGQHTRGENIHEHDDSPNRNTLPEQAESASQNRDTSTRYPQLTLNEVPAITGVGSPLAIHQGPSSSASALQSTVDEGFLIETHDDLHSKSEYLISSASYAFPDMQPSKPQKNSLKKSHTCESCSRAFQNESGLRNHYCTHKIDEQSFRCSYDGCGRLFIREGNKNLHELLHVQPESRPPTPQKKLHTCENCGKDFRDTFTLRRHYRSHACEQPFRCSYDGCGRLFKREGNKNRHERNFHSSLNRQSKTANPI
ncbi:hypothetical protein N7466_011063 [Penicillium verhagenii]|uniref:uncharacterized protein n=1 Tax=Penicillium verhagenii TaxID=1562060 RepID=UPI002545657B|nr:uncharacterized protein N7466_011063 [Penicillium verhagenii]KAJ5917509.1 hypothetical protein N7466_011063 [Penicillium verhagenii]